MVVHIRKANLSAKVGFSVHLFGVICDQNLKQRTLCGENGQKRWSIGGGSTEEMGVNKKLIFLEILGVEIDNKWYRLVW